MCLQLSHRFVWLFSLLYILRYSPYSYQNRVSIKHFCNHPDILYMHVLIQIINKHQGCAIIFVYRIQINIFFTALQPKTERRGMVWFTELSKLPNDPPCKKFHQWLNYIIS